MNEGWVCPVCRRGIAPDMKSCDHQGAATQPLYPWPYGVTPWGIQPSFTRPFVVTCNTTAGAAT